MFCTSTGLCSVQMDMDLENFTITIEFLPWQKKGSKKNENKWEQYPFFCFTLVQHTANGTYSTKTDVVDKERKKSEYTESNLIMIKFY